MKGVGILNPIITVVCRHNQARSVLASAAIARHFLNVDVISAGVNAVDGQRIPQSILELANTWGLNVLDLVSHSLQDVEQQILTSEFVIVAEDEFKASIVKLGFAAEKVLSMQDERFDHEFIPFDPIGQGGRVLSVEISKAVMTAVQLLRAQKGFGRNYPVEAIFTDNEYDFQKKLALTWDGAVRTNGVVILADFRAPNLRSVSEICDNVLEVRVNRVDQGIVYVYRGEELDLQKILELKEPIAISGRFEMDQAEKFVFRSQFIGLINTLATIRPITILTEPLSSGPLAFLVASHANIR